ncbi:hypothetical protein EJ110_NYTH35045 [Nymphaea thermarum]|nr:hypothetical protein EJ110_NYTH35045 [Nymphaea thermarum]
MKSSPFSSLITKMNGGNYEMWAMQVKRTLITHDKEHLILEPEPVQKVGKYGTWFKDNSLVMVWIVGTLSQDIANEVLHKESAKDMWDSLAATYLQARNETRIMQLHHDIHQMRQDGRPLHTYYSSLKSMFERLNSYFPAYKCEQQKAYRDMLMVGVFLSGLDSVYESAKNQMLTSPSIPPIDEAYSRLSRISIPAAAVPDTTSAMLATRGRGGSFFARGRGGRGRGTPTPRPVCQFCHRIGHTVDKCWQKHGRPAFANQTASTESSEPPKAQHTAPSSELRVDDLLSQLRSLIGDRPQHAPDPTTSTVTTAASASSSDREVTLTQPWPNLCPDGFRFTVCRRRDCIDGFHVACIRLHHKAKVLHQAASHKIMGCPCIHQGMRRNFIQPNLNVQQPGTQSCVLRRLPQSVGEVGGATRSRCVLEQDDPQGSPELVVGLTKLEKSEPSESPIPRSLEAV